MGILGILGTPLGYVLQWIYQFVGNYGWSIILFTVIVRLLSFPLQIKQQKSTARMAAYQPMIQEIQKKYANDKEKQNEELMRMQQEYGYNPAAGCAPMLINFLVIFGIIEVVYRPLKYIMHLPAEALNAAASQLGMAANNYMAQSEIIKQVQLDPTAFGSIFTAEQIEAMKNFNVDFLGINLMDKPGFALNALLIFPLLSIVTMAMLNVITMKMSGQQMQGSMKWMPWITSLMFVWFAFQVPVGFSLYYTVSNLFMFVQSVILRKMYDPEKLKVEIAAEIEAKKLERKAKKQVTVVENGKEITRSVNEAELNRLRLEMARKQDEEKYKDERTVPLSQLNKEE
ncbi:MAG: YidC/Oxa1 family membrane protein insertase [Fournierella sp.]|uniref:YidC/Oxa1 family membrane protein insertase n=1 Tax=Allofournierella sp. TaxID=1940256 RepID=UPI002A81A84B|nr:YidC/Oxa1 family membrane protein insertase [Fournierella sp.]MDY4166757.1 YidC/Oxa1 family membrane protein insertase [Fournierella sp.]